MNLGSVEWARCEWSESLIESMRLREESAARTGEGHLRLRGSRKPSVSHRDPFGPSCRSRLAASADESPAGEGSAPAPAAPPDASGPVTGRSVRVVAGSTRRSECSRELLTRRSRKVANGIARPVGARGVNPSAIDPCRPSRTGAGTEVGAVSRLERGAAGGRHRPRTPRSGLAECLAAPPSA